MTQHWNTGIVAWTQSFASSRTLPGKKSSLNRNKIKTCLIVKVIDLNFHIERKDFLMRFIWICDSLKLRISIDIKIICYVSSLQSYDGGDDIDITIFT